MPEADLRDAALIASFIDGIRQYREQGGAVTSIKALRELIWFYWENPRMPFPKVKSKYPIAFPWSPNAIAAYKADNKRCRLVIEHSRPVSGLLAELLADKPLTTTELVQFLHDNLGHFVVITPGEDAKINAAGLKQKMPDGWQPGDDLMARHRAAGLEVDRFRPLREVLA